ncbi:Centrosomal protein of 85 kDa-like [Orchesella cincta]|uniref:Centrosomal protein of 85 kDa-like n=1 Tax=Orchesella cincta TaxID=48709 RepID=A0A1D2N994_ORCCI|nr:Centrosomal protein of 85 kDa-like [Orchesella cincta]
MSATPKSVNGDLHDLRYRISQLEHLFVNSSLNSSLTASSLPTSELRTLQTQHELIERISGLEGLLAASELENQNLRQVIAVLEMDKKRDDVILLEKLYAKDKEVQRLQNEVSLLETKLGKSERMIENVKDYINTLPAQDEVDEAKDAIVRLESDNHVLSQKVEVLEGQVKEQQKELIEKSNLIQEQIVRLEEIRPLEEAQTTILRRAEEGSLDFQDEKHIQELVTVQKAQLLRSAKLISSLRDKLTQCQNEKGDLQERLSCQGRDIEKLQEELLVIQLTMEKTTQKVKSLEQEKLSLLDEKSQLQTMLEERETFIKQRDSQFNNIIRLVTEIDLCVNDVGKLVELGESIVKGEDPPVTSLLGLSDELEMHLQSLDSGGYELDHSLNHSHSSSFSKGESGSLVTKYLASLNNGVSSCNEFSLGDMEWALDRIKKIRDMRQNIGFIRDQINDLYTEMLGGKVEGCAVQ